ncbi:hypothetical protein LX36DRAFT_656389 [Colletotrichum falcatum]|nr:hypothetical protein LX36DRAFT_656389 [Colletotrichum falcatum]
MEARISASWAASHAPFSRLCRLTLPSPVRKLFSVLSCHGHGTPAASDGVAARHSGGDKKRRPVFKNLIARDVDSDAYLGDQLSSTNLPRGPKDPS